MKKILIISLGLIIVTSGLIIGFHISGKTNISEESIHNLIQKETDEIYDSLVKIRRDFHMYPELSEHEKRTSEKIESYLRKLGLDVKTNIGGYGVVGILRGNKDGKHLAWRADIDAFWSNVPDVVEFESKNKNVRHICGHDVHATIGLGIANILSKHKDKINGTIYFIFQPSEEVCRGAETMIRDGLFNIIKPSEVYALHVAPLPVGIITTKENELYAYNRNLTIKLKGITNEDAVLNYTQTLTKSYNTVDDQFWDMKNLTNPQIGIFNPQSIFKNYLAIQKHLKTRKEKDLIEISISLSGTDLNVIDSLPIKLKGTIKKSQYADNLVSIDYLESYPTDNNSKLTLNALYTSLKDYGIIMYPTVNNNSKLTQEAVNSIMKVYGQNSFIPLFGVINQRNDDFAYFQQHVPGVYFFLGGSNSLPHSPNFTVDEECIKVGVKYFSTMIVERLKDE
jgi:metal-dependent amidase/aminoacylase/carboxypeptidase family protein